MASPKFWGTVMVVPLVVAFTEAPATAVVVAPAVEASGMMDPFNPITALCEPCPVWSTATGWYMYVCPSAVCNN